MFLSFRFLSMVPEDFHRGYLPVSIPFDFCIETKLERRFLGSFFFFLVDLLLILVCFFQRVDI